MASYFDPAVIAIEICNKEAFKTEVFSGIYPDPVSPRQNKRFWDGKVEALTVSLLADYNLEAVERELVIGVVFSIALRMLEWIEYFAGTFNFTRDFCIEFLEQSLFTSNGIIDPQRVRTKLSKESLDNLQKFQLACFYCDHDNIPNLFKSLSEEEKELVYNDDPTLVKQTEIVKFWSYQYKGEIDQVKLVDKVEGYRMRAAILSGSQIAINYCLGRLISKEYYAVDTAASVFRHRMYVEASSTRYIKTVTDWVIFRKERYNCSEGQWVPRTFYADIVYSLFANFSPRERRDFWLQVFDRAFVFVGKTLTSDQYANLLDYFLFWPYHEMFRQMLKSAFQKIPFKIFSAVLRKLTKRIEPKMGQMSYYDDKLYDFRQMVIDEWTRCPRLTKIFLLRLDKGGMLGWFHSIYNLETFNETYSRFIKSILESASEKDRYFYMMENSGFAGSLRHLQKRMFDLLDDLVLYCLPTPPETASEYKLRIIVIKAMELDCLTYVKNGQWDEAEKSLRWSGYPMSENDFLKAKKILLLHHEGKEACIEFWKTDPAKADEFIHWCVPGEEENFKEKLIYSKVGQEECRMLCLADPEQADAFVSWWVPPDKIPAYKSVLAQAVDSVCMCAKYVLIDDRPHLADHFMQWCLPEDRIRRLKVLLGHVKIEVFPIFLTAAEDVENCTDEEFPERIYDWTPAEKMFVWWFGSDPDEITRFKNGYLKKFKREIIYKSIASNRWDIADRLLSFLQLDGIDVRITKVEQISVHSPTKSLLNGFLSGNEDDPIFAERGGRQRAIETFIHWFLVDDGQTIPIFTRWLIRFSDDSCIQNILTKLKGGVETVRRLLKP